jgi:triacylglycerol lipase
VTELYPRLSPGEPRIRRIRAALAGSGPWRPARSWAGLSRRRRRFAAWAAALLAGGLVALGVTLASGGTGPGRPAGYPAQDQPGTVLLVPGYGGSTAAVSVLAARIRRAGRAATVVRLPGNGTQSLTADAAALNAVVDRALQRGAPSVDVIGYSAGGVAALLWARDDDGAQKARRVITLGSPFHGTRLAAAGAAFVPGACPAACRQLLVSSPLLARLNAAGAIRRPRWLSLWTTDDKVVIPADSARLAGAVDVPLQSVCPGLRVSHSELPVNPVVTQIVLRAIGPGPLRYPGAAVCRG